MKVRKRSMIEMKAFSRHGDIYRWLRENYDRVEPEILQLNRTWEAIAADIAAEGVTGARGKEPYSNSVRRIWPRVCRDVKAERERQAQDEAVRQVAAEARRGYPSRLPADWRPEPIVKETARPSSNGSGRAIVPVAGRSSGRERESWEKTVSHPKDRQREVPQRVMSEGELRVEMTQKLPDGRLTPRAVELKLAWCSMEGRRQDQWLGVPQGMLVLENEVILVEFENKTAVK
jgi:hypothetical protein